MLRIFAIGANIAVLVWFSIELETKHLSNLEDLLLALLLGGTPILSLITLFRTSDAASWLSLYLKRKAAEERARLAAIEKEAAARTK